VAGSQRYICTPAVLQPVLTLAGNFYSIENVYDKPARIFFAQGCEIQEEITDGQ
jgi:hypothetical protein